MIFKPEICYATTTAVEMINAVNANFVENIDASYDWWYWIAGIMLAFIALTMFANGFKFLFRTLFKR